MRRAAAGTSVPAVRASGAGPMTESDDRGPATRRRCTARTVGGVLLVLLSLAAAARAQSFGRWWWDGSLGASERSNEARREGSAETRLQHQDLTASFGLNGYLGHPAVGRFRLGLDVLLSEVGGARRVDRDRYGFRLDLSAFPMGRYPAQLTASRSLFDFSAAGGGEQALGAGTPDVSTHWSGRLRVRHGPMVGTLLGTERRRVEFLHPEEDDELFEHHFVDWSRGTGEFDHHARLALRRQDFGVLGLTLEDLTLNVDERAVLSGRWTWQLSGTGIRRALESSDGRERRIDSTRARTVLYRTIGERDRLDLRASLGLSEPDNASAVRTAGASAAYRWRFSPGWEIAPFLDYFRQSAGTAEAERPEAGVEVSWRRRTARFESLAGGRLGYARLETRDDGDGRTEAQTTASVGGSVVHGEASGLRKEIEVELGRNDVRVDEVQLTEIPDLGAGNVGFVADYARARLQVGHRWDSRFLSTWSEWSRRESSRDLRGGQTASETLTGAAQFGSRTVTLQANLSETELSGGDGDDQSLFSIAGSARWRPWRFVSLGASIRQTERELELAATLDNERYEAFLSIQIGRLTVDARAFESKQTVGGGTERVDRGVYWSLRRSFAGWLPIVTGGARRGTIR